MKIVKSLFVLFFILSFTSCAFTENIYVNEDGSGKFSVDMDGSSLMSMMPADSLKNEKAMDSVFAFKEIFEAKKDSIAKLSKEEQENLKKLENFSMRMKMNPKEQQFVFSMFTDFKSVTELQDAMATMNTIQSIKKEKDSKNPLSSVSGMGNNNSLLSYSYDGKKFSRKATLLKKQAKSEEQDSMQQAYKMIYEASTYTIKYHFPKKIKKVSNTTALYSEDRKSITIEYPFNEYMNNPDKLNFEVEFEK